MWISKPNQILSSAAGLRTETWRQVVLMPLSSTILLTQTLISLCPCSAQITLQSKWRTYLPPPLPKSFPPKAAAAAASLDRQVFQRLPRQASPMSVRGLAAARTAGKIPLRVLKRRERRSAHSKGITFKCSRNLIEGSSLWAQGWIRLHSPLPLQSSLSLKLF